MFGRLYEEFNLDETYAHWPGKTITESDNNLFCLLTMNHHPVHLDTQYAEQQVHGKILVVGTLVFSVVVGQSVRDVSGAAIANLGYQDVVHHGPVFIGDTIYSRSTVISKRLSKSNNSRGIVTVLTNAYNENDNLVLSFKRSILVPTLT